MNRQARALAHPAIAGLNDPVTITLLLDCLMRLEHDTAMRTHDLVNILDVEYPQILWSAIVVGRILSDLAEACKGSGITPAPIALQKTGQGNRYIVQISQEGWKWLAKARTLMGQRAERLIEEERGSSIRITVTSFPFDVIDLANARPETGDVETGDVETGDVETGDTEDAA